MIITLDKALHERLVDFFASTIPQMEAYKGEIYYCNLELRNKGYRPSDYVVQHEIDFVVNKKGQIVLGYLKTTFRTHTNAHDIYFNKPHPYNGYYQTYSALTSFKYDKVKNDEGANLIELFKKIHVANRELLYKKKQVIERLEKRVSRAYRFSILQRMSWKRQQIKDLEVQIGQAKLEYIAQEKILESTHIRLLDS